MCILLDVHSFSFYWAKIWNSAIIIITLTELMYLSSTSAWFNLTRQQLHFGCREQRNNNAFAFLTRTHKDAADCDGRGKTQWNAAQMQRTTFPSSPLCFSFFSSPLFSFPASWARSSWQVGQRHDAFWQLSNFTAVSRLALTLFF